MPVPLAIGAALGTAYQLGTGIAQGIQARRARRQIDALMANRPEYTRPGEVNVNTGLAAARVGDAGFAGENAARARAELNAANTASLAGAGGDPFAAALASQAQLDATQLQITGTGEQIRQQNEQQLSQALLTSAQYADQEFQMNEMAPWMDAMARAQNDFRDYRQGSIRNIGGALNNVSSISLGALAAGGFGAQGFGADPSLIADIVSRYNGQQGTAATGQSTASAMPASAMPAWANATSAAAQGQLDWAELFRVAGQLQNRPR